MFLVVTIDTEEDNWGNFDNSALGLRNIKKIPKLQDIFDKYEVRPNYLVTYPVAYQEESSETLRNILRNGRCEVGAHLHPWNTPPIVEERNQKNSMLIQLDPDLQFRKLKNLTEIIKTNFDTSPISFRGGRWAFDEHVARNIYKLGYRIDTSVTPFTDWKYCHGPDYSSCLPAPYRFSSEDIYSPNRNGPMIEIPASVGFSHRPVSLLGNIYSSLKKSVVSKSGILGVLGSLRLLKKIWLSPEVSSLPEMKRLLAVMKKDGYKLVNMVFHSTTLEAGLTPFIRTRADEEDFLRKIDRFLHFAKEFGFRPITLSDCVRRMDELA